MKYIIIDCGGIETPILFPATLTHADIAKSLDKKVISAGFCLPTTETTRRDYDIVPSWEAFGYSESLGVKSRKEDADLIMRMVNLSV